MEVVQNLIALVLYLHILPVVVNSESGSDFCNCGFTGLCVYDPDDALSRQPCNATCPISGGFYEDDCETIIDYCSSSPCWRGSCVSTFGNYFCKCPKGVFGRNCEIDEEPLRSSGLKQDLYVYYQVQPWRSSGPNLFTVVFDPSRESEDDEKRHFDWIIQLVVNISDGRSYHPRRQHFQRSVIKSKCLQDAYKNSNLRDPRICDYLPPGNVSSFSFDTSYFGPPLKDALVDALSIPGLGEVGRSSNVSLYVYLIHSRNRTRTKEVFSAIYSVFNYVYYRAPHNCIMEMTFTHCSSDHRFPYVHSRGNNIEIDAIHRDKDCTGYLVLGSQWAIQRHTDSLCGRIGIGDIRDSLAVLALSICWISGLLLLPVGNPIKEKDFMPVPIVSGATQLTRSVKFNPYFFRSGIHMIQYALKLRGNPPHYGGSDEFDMKGECWIDVFTLDPLVEVKGGEVQTVSCYETMSLELMNLNHDVDINEMIFETSCNDTDDIECHHKVIDTPFISKDATKCNSYLKITVVAKAVSLDLVVPPLTIIIHFIESAASIQVECLYNCYPIDPTLRTILAATSVRYFPFDVNWEVNIAGSTKILKRDGEINAFLPASATRILRINSERLKLDGDLFSTVHFKAHLTGNPGMRAEVSTVTDNLETNLKDFVLTLNADGFAVHKFERIHGKRAYTFPPVRYSIRQIYAGTSTEDDVVLLETNYEEQLSFSPFWKTVMLCVYNSYSHFACGDVQRIGDTANPEDFSVEDLRAMLQIRDYYDFFKKVFIYLWNKITTAYDFKSKKYAQKWNITVRERLEVAKLLNEVPYFKGLVDINLALRSAVRLLYSKLGNQWVGLNDWIDENFTDDPESVTVWLMVRYEALTAIESGIVKRYEISKKYRETAYSVHEFEEFRSVGLLGMTLAYILNNDKRVLINRQKNPTVQRRIQEGIQRFWLWKSDHTFSVGLDLFNKVLSLSTILFHSISVYGGKFSKVYTVRSTYVGILEAFKKRPKDHPLKETFGSTTDYIFGPEHPLTKVDAWIEPVTVQLPPVTIDWEYLELALLVNLAKNREGDKTVSPILILELRRSAEGAQLYDLPDFKPVNITLPRMEGGELVSEASHKWYTDNLSNATSKGSPILAFKITLPVEFNFWTVYIKTDSPNHIKAKVFDKVPDEETVMATPDLIPVYDPIKKTFYTTVEVLPPEGSQFIPYYFYLGIASPSKGLQTNLTDQSIISCNCNRLGLYQATTLPITITKLLLALIPFRLPYPFSFYNAVVVGILAFFAVVLSIFAYWKDRRSSRSHDNLIYLRDNHPSDDYLVVVGVFTGLHLQGGTTSKVAIKLIGQNASSRVHVLSTSQRKTLSTGQDHWFVMAVSEPLGKLKSVQLWLDHRDLSGWYCKRIIVQDLHDHGLFVAHVEKWLIIRVLEDVPRVENFDLKHVDMFNEETSPVDQIPHSFFTNYLTELRNTHLELSFFLMQDRYIYKYHVKCSALIGKVLAIYLWIWFFQEVVFEWTHGRYLDPVSTRRMLGLSKELFIWAFWAALLSHPYTFLIDYLYRCSHISGSLQKRTTNPLYMFYIRGSAASSSKISTGLPEHALYIHSGDWRKHVERNLLLAVGPCQFRCVDSDKELISIKTRHMTRVVKFVSFVIITALFSAIVIIEFFTDYQWKSNTCAIVVAIAFILDAFFLSPFLILLKTSVGFYIFEMNNKEKVLLRREVREIRKLREHYLDYLIKVLGKEYKPLLSTEIKRLKKKKMVHSFVLKSLVHLVAVFTMIIIIKLLISKFSKEDFYMMRTLRNSFETTGHPDYGISGTSINRVYDVHSAADYVTNSVADFTGVWHNGKVINGSLRAPHVRWSDDHFGQGIGSTCVLLLFQDDDAGQVIPIEFDDYFETAIGTFSVTHAKKEPIVRGGDMEYTVISSSWIYGKSGIWYPLAGHLRVIPFVPWENYYSNMRILMDDFVSKENDDCRAVIISTNYIYPFVRYIVTIDVIIEFHASGTGGAMSHVQGIKIDSSTSSGQLLRWIILGLFIVFTFYTIAVICREGPKQYFFKWSNIIRGTALLSLGATVIWHALRVQLKYAVIHKLTVTPVNDYSDLHSIYTYEVVDSFLLLLVFLLFLIDLMLVIPRFLGSEWLKIACKSTIRLGLLFCFLQLYVVAMLRVSARTFPSNSSHLFIVIQSRQIPSSILSTSKSHEKILVYMLVVFVTIMDRGLIALIICMSLNSKGRLDTPYSRYKALIKTKIEKPAILQSSIPLPKPKKTKWTDILSTISPFKKSSNRKQGSSPKKPSAVAHRSAKLGKKHKLFS